MNVRFTNNGLSKTLRTLRAITIQDVPARGRTIRRTDNERVAGAMDLMCAHKNARSGRSTTGTSGANTYAVMELGVSMNVANTVKISGFGKYSSRIREPRFSTTVNETSIRIDVKIPTKRAQKTRTSRRGSKFAGGRTAREITRGCKQRAD